MRRRPIHAAALVVLGMLAAGCGAPTASTSVATATPAGVAAHASATSAAVRYSPKLTLQPTHGPIGTVVHVTGTGYAPTTPLTGSLCAVDALGNVSNPLAACDVADTVTITTDAQGDFAADYTVKRVPPPQAGYAIGFGTAGDNADSAGATFAVDP